MDVMVRYRNKEINNNKYCFIMSLVAKTKYIKAFRIKIKPFTAGVNVRLLFIYTLYSVQYLAQKPDL